MPLPFLVPTGDFCGHYRNLGTCAFPFLIIAVPSFHFLLSYSSLVQVASSEVDADESHLNTRATGDFCLNLIFTLHGCVRM